MSGVGFAYHAARDPERLAAIGPGGEVWTRGRLAQAVNALSRSLQRRGLQAGERIAILSPNCVEFVAIHLAATQIGLYVVPVNWHLAAAEIDHIIRDSHAAALFVHAEIYAAIVGALPASTRSRVAVYCVGEIDGAESVAGLLASSSGEPLEDTPAMGTTLFYTSATTGLPKAVVVPLEQTAASLERDLKLVAAAATNSGAPPDSDQAYLCISMLYHGAPLNGVLFTLHLGNPVVIMNGWTAAKILEEIQRHRVRTTFMVPSMFVRLLKLSPEARARFDLSSLRCVSHGGAPCPVDTKRQMIEWLGPILLESYGASEGGGTIVTSAEWLRYPGTVGRPFPGGDIRILDDDGAPVPPGTVGNIFLKSYNGSRFEYLGDRSKTDAAYRGEYFTVGDVGYVNEEGYLFICDRRIDMIIASGMKIYPAEIERVLVTHPSVRDCAVIGVPDQLHGEKAVAVIELEEGHGADAALASQILAFLLERLGSMKVPSQVRFVDSLPRDPSGKLFKRLLKERLAQ